MDDTVSPNLAGVGTLFHHWSGRKWVFLEATEPVALELPKSRAKAEH
ncbi:hypothetical protein [Nonomuraea sp. NPDC049695]